MKRLPGDYMEQTAKPHFPGCDELIVCITESKRIDTEVEFKICVNVLQNGDTDATSVTDFACAIEHQLKVDAKVLQNAGDDAQQVDVREVGQVREATGLGPNAGLNGELINKGRDKAEDRDVGQVDVVALLNTGCLGGGNVDGMGARNGEGLASAGVENGLNVNLGKIQKAAGDIVDSAIDGKLVDQSADNVQDGDAG
ncbi:hypothetical protein N7451_006355 [Penicillium sp. IBT 35674x]|nr:hypothetical protein N7451_006355 [Penicillium sp. IBT 35674x]